MGIEAGGWHRELETSAFRIRPGTQWEAQLRGRRGVRGKTSQQFVTSLGGGSTETFGTRYIFAQVDRSEVAARFRLNYTFTPRPLLSRRTQSPLLRAALYQRGSASFRRRAPES